MPSINDVFKSSEKIACEDLQGSDVVLTIKSIEIIEFDDDGRKVRKPIVEFDETPKTFIANKTNSMMICEHYGDNYETWPGKKITLYPSRTDFGGKMVDCIRIRPPRSSGEVSQGLPNADHPNAPGNDPVDDIPF